MISLSAMKILFIADVWDTLDHARDSTLHLAAHASNELGFRCFWSTPADLFLLNGQLFARASELAKDAATLNAQSSASGVHPLSDYHSIHWRADPPVDLMTYQLWSLLMSAPKPLKIFPPPAALLSWNEKFSPTRFGDSAIPALVTHKTADLEKFAQKIFEKRAKLVLKPAGDAASRGVVLLSPPYTQETASKISEHFAKHGPWLVAQEFDVALLEKGETRAFIIDGKLEGVLGKKPSANQPIMSLDAVDEAKPTLKVVELTAPQKKIVEAVSKALSNEQILLSTIDFIGDRILEINVTSAGLLKWMDENGHELGKKYWHAVLKRCKAEAH